MRHLVTLLLLLSLCAPALAESPPVFLLQWGGQGGGNGVFQRPYDIEVGPDGSVYVTDATRCQRFSNSGTWLATFANSGTGQLLYPSGIAVDNLGDVYISGLRPSNSAVVMKVYDTNGIYLRTWGQGLLGDAAGVSVDASRNVYVSDFVGHRVRKFDRLGASLGNWGGLGSGDGQFNTPFDNAVDPFGNVFVSDYLNHRVQVFTSTGAFLRKWGTEGSGPGQFTFPNPMATDAAGNVYVGDAGDAAVGGRIQKFDGQGNLIWELGSTGPGWFIRSAIGLSVDFAGNLFVLDELGYVLKFGPAPVPVTPTSWGRVKNLYR